MSDFSDKSEKVLKIRLNQSLFVGDLPAFFRHRHGCHYSTSLIRNPALLRQGGVAGVGSGGKAPLRHQGNGQQ